MLGLGVAAAFGPASAAAGGPARASDAPNFLLIQVDDQARNSFKPKFMPQTFERIVDPGTFFTDGLAAPPLCCPDRAGVLTGEYPHDHGVYSNDPGYPDLQDPQDTLPVWLRNAGYRTALIGKFLNGYTDVAGTAPAPGFDRWFSFLFFPRYYDYRVSDDGRVRTYGGRRSQYSTDVLTRHARRFLRDAGRSRHPFFLWLAYNAPHGGTSRLHPCQVGQAAAPPGRAVYRRFAHSALPRPPSFNEPNVSDKPAAISSLAPLGPGGIRRIRHIWRCGLGAVSELDKGVGRVMSELRGAGELRKTIVFYLSDNGFFFGEHRLAAGKSDVYEPALNVPYAVRVPAAYRRGAAPPRRHAVVTNQDVAPTMIDYASRYLNPIQTCAAPGDCRRMDGRSLAPLLSGPGRWPHGRGVLAEIADQPRADYHAIRTPRYVYSELATGERELYDLHTDPFELQNLAGDPADAQIQAELAVRLARLESCSGVAGRDPATAAPFCE